LANPASGQWVGPNLIQNGNFSQGSSSWTSNPSGGNFSNNEFLFAPVQAQAITQTVSLVSGKRYAASAQVSDGYLAGQVTTYAWETQIATPVGSSGYIQNATQATASVAPAIYSGQGNTVSISEAYTGNRGDGAASVTNVALWQVVYVSQLQLVVEAARVNTTAPGGATGTAGVVANSLSFADDPTSSSIDWGDGSTPDSPSSLNSTFTHDYALGSGINLADYTVTLNGSNQAGSTTTTAAEEILRSPEASLTIDGTQVNDGQVFDVLPNTDLSLSLENSTGYIESASFSANGFLDQSGTGLTADLAGFPPSDGGLVIPLTITVSNTGAGLNSQSLTVDIQVVPEPSAIALLTITGAILLARGRPRST
jgi:hypothetical protein